MMKRAFAVSSPRSKPRRTSQSVDDYLKAIYTLGAETDRRVGGSELAEELHVAPASVTNMLQKLAAEKPALLDYQRSKGVRLSAPGRRRALEIVRHHRLIETFLYEMLDYPLEKLHDEAERLEHFISEDFEARIAEKLGHPQADPHGHCIPSIDGKMPAAHSVSCKCGTREVDAAHR
jgi:DtxR family Mn-dependent transcriptional regulator